MRANVRSDGQFAEGSRSTSSERDGTGTYLVMFARDVSKCTPVASAGGGESDSSSYFATFGTARSPSGDKHTAFVQFRGSSLAWIDTAFHLIVAS